MQKQSQHTSMSASIILSAALKILGIPPKWRREALFLFFIVREYSGIAGYDITWEDKIMDSLF